MRYYPRTLRFLEVTANQARQILSLHHRLGRLGPLAVYGLREHAGDHRLQWSAPLIWRLLNFCRERKIKLIADCTEWYDPRDVKYGQFGPFRWIANCACTGFSTKIGSMIAISSFLERYYGGARLPCGGACRRGRFAEALLEADCAAGARIPSCICCMREHPPARIYWRTCSTGVIQLLAEKYPIKIQFGRMHPRDSWEVDVRTTRSLSRHWAMRCVLWPGIPIEAHRANFPGRLHHAASEKINAMRKRDFPRNWWKSLSAGVPIITNVHKRYRRICPGWTRGNPLG